MGRRWRLVVMALGGRQVWVLEGPRVVRRGADGWESREVAPRLEVRKGWDVNWQWRLAQRYLMVRGKPKAERWIGRTL